MKKDWFVLHALTGQENKVMKSILARTKLEDMGEFVGDCVIPSEKVTEKRDGKTRTYSKKFFPGYVLVQLALYDESRGIDPATGRKAVHARTWQFLRETPGVIGSWLTQYPQPLKEEEVAAILSDKPAEADKPRPKIDFAPGEKVKIKDGAFMGMEGIVSVVDPDKAKLRVEVEVFSRTVPVDADYWQVEKAPEKETAS